MLQKGTPVELARTHNPVDMPDADHEDAILVAITRDGKFWLGQERISIEDLSTRVSDILATKMDKTVFVRSDYRSKYGDVVQVVDTIRNAGVDKVGLLTERLDDRVRQ
jgi:biopolymer transport protein ExbD/biopolymer transport protein TolR